jgi:metal-sulfur cluster biosynthetic enzyme
VSVQPEIEQRLSALMDPCSVRLGRPLNIVEMGLVESVTVEDGTADVQLVLTEPSCIFFFDFHQAIERTLLEVDGIEAVNVAILDGEMWTPDRIKSLAPALVRSSHDAHSE